LETNFLSSPIILNIGLYTIVAILAALFTDYLVTPVLIVWTKPFGKEKA